MDKSLKLIEQLNNLSKPVTEQQLIENLLDSILENKLYLENNLFYEL